MVARGRFCSGADQSTTLAECDGVEKGIAGSTEVERRSDKRERIPSSGTSHAQVGDR